MKKLNFMLLIALASVSMLSCKKDSTEDTPAPIPVNQLCDGNGGTSIFPLDSTDTWTYSYTIMGISQTSPTLTVTGHQTHSSKVYATIHDASHLFQVDDALYREDATTHNIYYYNDNDNTEYLFIPGSPTLNQSWPHNSSYTHKVTNLSASLATASCSYTGLLEISALNSSGVVTNKYYFKKGLGLVSLQDVGSFPGIFNLTSVSLK